MIIELIEIKENGLSRHYTIPPDELPDSIELEVHEDFKLIAPVEIELYLIRIGSLIKVKGSFSTKLESFCGRCLKDFSFDLNDSFELIFTNEPITVHEDGADDEEGVELSAEELGLISFSGESIDLDEAIGEQLFLAFPVRALCSEECRGLCPHCGIDLNKSKCHCTPADFNNKFSALKNIKIN